MKASSGGTDADFPQDSPLVGATITVDHLVNVGTIIEVRNRVAELTTDSEGYFVTLTGQQSGLFRITTRGGSFRDYATGQTIVLDEADGLTALLDIDRFEDLTTGLVTPVTHLVHTLIDARTQAGTDADLVTSYALVTEHVDRHFGDLHWERIAPADLTAAQTSPTAEVRAAFLLGAWSLLAQDIALAAGATAQQVNPFTLARDLGRDLAAPPFDGNDGNDRTANSGIQFALCAPVPPGCLPTGSAEACTINACRTACDAYAGTARTGLAAAVTRLINDNGADGRNQTGLAVADALRFARAIADAQDPILFGDTCTPVLDQTAPRVTFGATPPPGALVRGALEITAVATDDTDPAPVLTLSDLTDTDGASTRRPRRSSTPPAPTALSPSPRSPATPPATAPPPPCRSSPTTRHPRSPSAPPAFSPTAPPGGPPRHRPRSPAPPTISTARSPSAPTSSAPRSRRPSPAPAAGTSRSRPR
jgi:hypothetical protein